MTADLREELARHAATLGPDEVKVLVTIAKRLVMGRAQYGELRLATDGRSFTREAAEEALDLSVYLACDLVKRGGV